MFGKANQYATVSDFGVRVKDEREKDRNHIIEANFEVPLTHDLADQIMPAMARDLFQEVGGDWVPKPEIDSAVFNLATETQVMTVREHPDNPLFSVEGVSIRKVRAKKGSGTWVLVFTASWIMTDSLQAVSIIRLLKAGVYLTFVIQSPRLNYEGDAPPEGGKTATVDQGGNVTSITEGKKKGGRRRKLSPEAEAAAQAAEGGDKAASEGDDETTH